MSAASNRAASASNDGNSPTRICVLLAAGRGSRMGSTKQLKLWPTAEGPKPLICAAYDSVQSICDRFVVVLGHDAEKVAAALRTRAFEPAYSSADVSMAESICAGLRAAMAIDPNATVVLQPGDHPEVAPATLVALVAGVRERPDRAIIPQYNNRGGHPALIPSSVVEQILASTCADGLKRFWTEHPELSWRLPVDDPTVVRDVDTPADLPD